MAPHNKRTCTSKAPTPTKKAKVQASEEPVDALTLQLTPILSAIAASKDAASCFETLRVALPHCLASPAAERHDFQIRILNLTTTTLKGLEVVAGADLADAQANADKLRTDGAVARATYEAAQKVAESKLNESTAKGAEVEKLQSQVDSAKLEVQGEVQKKEVFLAGSANLLAEQEAFKSLLDNLWEPLKTSKFTGQQWRKRDKACEDLIEKLRAIPLEESLLEALQVALKMKQDQRSSFGQKAVSCAEDAAENHKVQLAERIAATGTEEAAHDKAVAEAEARLAEVQAQLSKEDKEYDELQNSWAELESQAKEANNTATGLESEAEAALGEVETLKSELDAAVKVSAAFASLLASQEPVTTIDEAPEDAEPAANAVVEEAEAVAAC